MESIIISCGVTFAYMKLFVYFPYSELENIVLGIYYNSITTKHVQKVVCMYTVIRKIDKYVSKTVTLSLICFTFIYIYKS